MAYDEKLAARVRAVLPVTTFIDEKKMFGGLCWLLQGNMACGIHKDALIVRVGPSRYEESLKRKGVELFLITGRPMKGWISVTPAGCKTKKALVAWVEKGLDFAATLPPK